MAKTQNTPTVNEADQQLLEQLDAGFPPAWIAETAGDTIIGTFARLDNGRTSFGPCPVVVIATEQDGEIVERSVFLFYESLKSGFRRSQPVPGERIAVRYNGTKKVENQTPGRRDTYHDYSVAVDRPKVGGVVDWGAALGAEEPPPAASEDAGPDDIPF